MATLRGLYDGSSVLISQVPSHDDSGRCKDPNLLHSTFAMMVFGLGSMVSKVNTESRLDAFPIFHSIEDPNIYIPRVIASNENSTVFIKRHGDASIDPRVYAFKTLSLKSRTRGRPPKS